MKIKLGLGECNMARVAEFCGGELRDLTRDATHSFEYVCTDSREADENTMFVATRGERVDGHDYIIKAMELGCKCVLCEYVPENVSGKSAAFAVVENSIDAFALCAKGYRGERYMPSVAITGSVGKTTTKEMTAAILRLSKKTYCTEGNFNSVIGMPMSLMQADGKCECAVFEMGMSGFGEIRSMTKAANPTVAMVTNIGSSHLEYLKTRENIARAKLEIGEGIIDGGYLILNGDEPLLRDHYSDRYDTLYVGFGDDCGFHISNARVEADGTHFDLRLGCYGYIFDLYIPLYGKQFAYNAAFAASAAYLFGASESEIREGLAGYTAGKMRMNVSKKDGVTVIADCYNAAPESMMAALDALSSMKVEGRRIAVLGDMKELGDNSEIMHINVGKYAAIKGIDLLITVGELARKIAEGALMSGISNVICFNPGDHDAAAARLKSELGEGDHVLFKASRSMAFENIIEKTFN